MYNIVLYFINMKIDVENFFYLQNMNLECENVMRIYVDNKGVYDLLDLQKITNMICSLFGLYNNFLIKNGYQIDENIGRLIAQSVKEGSMIFDLVAPKLQASAEFFINNKTFDPIIEFGDYIKGIFDDLKEGRETKLEKRDYKYIQNTFGNLGNIGDDCKLDIKIYNINNPTIHIDCINNDFLTSNAINSICEKEIQKLEEENEQTAKYEKQLLKLTINNKDKIKGIISEIDQKEKQLIMTDNIKTKIVNDNENPFQKCYLVNLIVHYNDNKIINYEIIDIIDKIDTTDTDADTERKQLDADTERKQLREKYPFLAYYL